MTPRLLPLLSIALLAAGCASTSPKSAFDDVAQTALARTGHRVHWDQNTDEDAEAVKAIERLLSQELTVDAAVEIALLGSPRLRATFEELSIGQADLVQAGLLKNPVFTVGRTAWEAEHIVPNLFASVEQDFLDILTLPLRKRIAATELEATKLEVGDEILGLAAEVRAAFYSAQAAEQIRSMRRLVTEAAEASAELARRQHDAGNINELALGSELALSSKARVDAKKSEGDAAITREHLTKLMGLWGPRTTWRLSTRLPDLPADEVDPANLESIAVEKRLDLGAARRQVQAIGYAIGLAKTTRWTGTVTVDVEAGRLRGSRHLSFGPSVAVEVPLFDQRQAAIARLEAFERQAKDNLSAISIEARSDVRAARARLVVSRSVVEEYRTVLVPVRENVVKLSQEQYDAMLLGVYQLIQSKQTEFETYREYIEALRDYWIARSDLERVVGTKLAAKTATNTRGGT